MQHGDKIKAKDAPRPATFPNRKGHLRRQDGVKDKYSRENLLKLAEKIRRA